MLVRILIGLVLAIIGAFLTIKSDMVYQAVGPIAFAEKYLGSDGGSRLMYKLIGILITILGFLIMTGLIKNIVIAIFSALFVGNTQIPS